MTRRLHWQLSAMMFLQFAIPGAWMPVLSIHLNNLGIGGIGIGYVYGTMALAAMASPFIAGQIADRYFATERFLAFSHLAGGALLLLVASQTRFHGVYWAMLAFALIYVPTPALANSLAFRNLPDPEKQFTPIRVWGTVGFVVTAWLFGAWLGLLDPVIHAVSPTAAQAWAAGRASVCVINVGNCLPLAAGISIVYGLFSLTLPRTPPKRAARNPWAFLEALSLVRQRNFAVFFIVSFLVTTQTAFYYQLGPLFFRQGLGFADAWVGPTMSIGQVVEIMVIAALPLLLGRLGMRATIALGILAWALRYLTFAIGHPTALVIAAQALHGFCYGFFFLAGQIYANEVASGDIKASAQTLLIFATHGAGMFLGNLFAGWADVFFGRNFPVLFLVPVAIISVCAIAFLVGFSEDERRRAHARSAPGLPSPTDPGAK